MEGADLKDSAVSSPKIEILPGSGRNRTVMTRMKCDECHAGMG